MVEVVTTDDESSSVFSTQFNALYHSNHGAVQESRHVFLESGLEYYLQDHSLERVNILEIGFGTGLNALLTAHFIHQSNTSCFYVALEGYPLDENIIRSLNYGQLLNQKQLFEAIHSCEWEKRSEILSNFFLEKKQTLFEAYQSDLEFDIIYYDAFAPCTQAHLWEQEMMKKMYSLTRKGGILVTYCAKGTFRRTLESVGFTVTRIPGPPGKREMIRAQRIH